MQIARSIAVLAMLGLVPALATAQGTARKSSPWEAMRFFVDRSAAGEESQGRSARGGLLGDPVQTEEVSRMVRPALLAAMTVSALAGANGMLVQAAPPAWSPPAAPSPLREIWSFDTGG